MRIFLVGLSEGFARSVARYVNGDSRVALTGVAPSLALAGIMLPVTQTALALIDWSALGASPTDSLQTLRLGRPDLRIVCVVSEAETYCAAAAHVGADAVISKDGFAEELETLLHDYFSERGALCGGRDG